MKSMSLIAPVAFSYRTDPSVPPFDDAHPLVIFDGMCMLCSSGVQFMLARDPDGDTRFAAVQEPVPRALYVHYSLDPVRFDTFMVLAGGVPYLKWQGVLAAGRTMPGAWWWLAQLGRLVPNMLGDRLYDIVQRNRIGWFGSRDTCFMPSPGQRQRMLGTASTSIGAEAARRTVR
jgi:predicted DCC family thiol-disulfide oxidoreductase YuxK